MNISNSITEKPGIVTLKTSNTLHFSDKAKKPADDNVASSFADMLKGAVNKVNNLQIDSENLMQKMIYQPETVDIHTVMIAAQKAEIALGFTKAVRDEAVRAFRDIMNLR